jgi:phosphate transport system substrate-binding protein
VLGAVVPTYNVPGVKTELRFTAQILADIYLGKIQHWDDPALVKLNPEAGLPPREIVAFFGQTEGNYLLLD